MMRRNRLHSTDKFERVLKENRVVQRAAPLGRTSVTNGHTEFNGNESLIVNGSQKVNGWLIVTGTLRLIGSLLMEGFMTITGNVTATGVFNQNGPWNLAGTGGITGNVSSTGNWTQTGSYTVNGNGQIRFGNVKMGPTAVGGVSGITAESGTLALMSVGQVDILANSGIKLTAGDGVTIESNVLIKNLPIASGTVYMVVADAAGNLYRKSTAA
jgi:hypothetical protein